MMDPKRSCFNGLHISNKNFATRANRFADNSSGGAIKSEILSKQQLVNEVNKPIIRKFKKREVYSSFRDNIWDDDLADMHLISKYNKGIPYLLCVIDIYGKYVWVVPLKHKKVLQILKLFKNF